LNCAAANSLWLASCLPEYARFHRAARRVEGEQNAILMRVLAANADTEFGRSHGFSSIRTAREYQQRVPLREYEDYREWIGQIASGSSNVLSRERVRMLEPTSGSSSASKLIPYTDSLQREFEAGIRAWIADLFLHCPDLMAGQAYWAVSPAAAQVSNPRDGEIPIGFEDDTSYVGGWQSRLVQSVMAVPSKVRLISDMDTFRYVTLLFLLRSENLRLISVWNPTFLLLLTDRLAEWGEELAEDLANGTIRGGEALPPGLRTRVQPDQWRAREVRAALRANTLEEMHARLWPNLRLISCWADANAAGGAELLGKMFPQATVQGKGLLATEGFVSFPLAGREGAALAVRSHFLEFLPSHATGHIDFEHPRMAYDLERGQQYSVVLTTGGGLYRYALHDLIEVTGHFHGCPMVRFVGREGYVSDWFGEKLNEAHVSRVLQSVFSELGIAPSFAMLACETEQPRPGYVLYIDTAERDALIERTAGIVESALHENFHYRYARKLGQLSALRAFRAVGAAEAYVAASVRHGQRAGDVKPLALDKRNGWGRVFRAKALSASAG
jgi:GH3 auxin-responsive promoter